MSGTQAESRIRKASSVDQRVGTACNPQSPGPPIGCGDFHPGFGSDLPQPAQHLVLIAPQELPFSVDDATVWSTAGASRAHGPSQPSTARSLSCPITEPQPHGPIQRLTEAPPLARAATMNGVQYVAKKVSDVDASIAQEPIHLLHTMLGQRTQGLGQARAPLHGLPAKRSSARQGWRWPTTAPVWHAGRPSYEGGDRSSGGHFSVSDVARMRPASS